jgi:hypothetical protein
MRYDPFSFPLDRRCFLTRGGVAALGLLGALPTRADDPNKPDSVTSRSLINQAAQGCIDRGTDFLAKAQHEDGSFGDRQYKGNIAVTSLAALALMAGGHQPGRGANGKVVYDALQFVLAQGDRNPPGFLNNPHSAAHGPMYGHGFGTLFLAEAHGMVHGKKLREELHDKLKKAVEVIISSQNKEGGWRYHPVAQDADLSVTVCQIMALRAAHNVGLSIPDEVWEKCIEYVKACQDTSSGGFRYLKQGGPTNFARTAAGISALNSAGVYLNGSGRDPEKQKENKKIIEKGLEYLMNCTPNSAAGRRELRDMHYFYGHYYAVQAVWVAGEPRWSEWFPAIRDELVNQEKARGEGSWSDQISTHYATAMALLILQFPNNYLSIFQK